MAILYVFILNYVIIVSIKVIHSKLVNLDLALIIVTGGTNNEMDK